MKAFAVMPCTWSPSFVVITVTPVANIQRATERSQRIPSGLTDDLELVGLGGLLRERLADTDGCEPAV